MKRLQQKRARETLILDTAEAAIVEHGLFSLSLLEIARQAKCSVNTLYGSFATREDIAVALFNRTMARLGVKASQEIALCEGTVAERFLAMQLIWVRQQRQHFDMGATQFLAAMPCVWKCCSHARIATARSLLDMWYQENMRFLQLARESGELTASDEILHQCINEVSCTERGFSLFSNNYTMREEALSLPMVRIYKLMCFSLQELGLSQPPGEDSLTRVMAICDQVETQLKAFSADDFIFQLEERRNQLV